MRRYRKIQRTLFLFLIAGLASTPLWADPVTIDEIVYQSSTGLDPAALSGTADFTLNGSVLTIVLTNTSAVTGGEDATKLLAGIGFNLPTGVTIGGGSVVLSSSSYSVNFTTLTGNISQFWGYGVDRAPFAYGSELEDGRVNTSVSTLQSTHATPFAPGGPNLSGPGYGLLSEAQKAVEFGDGQPAVVDSITLTLNLIGMDSYGGDLIGYIQANHVALAFGSPDTSRDSEKVPEPATLLLFGAALASLVTWRRLAR